MTTPVALDSRIAVTEQQVSCELGDGTVILNLADGVYFELNAVGARVWELLQHGHTLTEIRDTLLQEYDVQTNRCTADVLAITTELVHAGLARVES